MGFWSGVKNWLVGGDATDAIDPNLKHGDYMGGFIQNQLGGVGGRQAPQAQTAQLGPASQLAGTNQSQIRDQQTQVAGRLMQIMNGQAPGAGELAVNRQIGQATAAQQAAARMARGANAALAARNAARNTVDLGVAGAGQAAQAQLQDQANATGQLGALLGTTRGQDLDLASQNAQLAQQRALQQGAFQQQTNLANQGAQLQTTAQNDQATLGYLAQLLGIDTAQLNALLAKQQVALQDQGHLGSLLQAGGQVAAAAAGAPA